MGSKIFSGLRLCWWFEYPTLKCEKDERTLRSFAISECKNCLEISLKNFRLGISEDEKVMLGNKKIDPVDSFTYLGSIISKDSGNAEGVKCRIAKAMGVFSQFKKKIGRIGKE